mmetsp:Transcript_36944/g.83929  ORF Transcript_36944/g.83929 Transcript_36944/m.83929 type:complete len:536 (+) Transcript_36944:521-2128(+)
MVVAVAVAASRTLRLLLAPDAVPEPHQEDVQLAVVTDEVGGRDGEESEGPDDDCHGVPLDMLERDAHVADDQGKLAHLREVDRRERGQATPASQPHDHREDAQPSEHQYDHGHEHRLRDHGDGWHGDLHAQAGEEEGDEEVPDELDLPVELRAVGEGGQGDACDERRQLHGEVDEGEDRGAADEEAPGQGEHEHELDAPGGVEEHGGHHELCVCQGDGDEHPDHDEGLEDAQDLGAVEVGLDRQDHDGPDVLEDEDADGQPACGRAHLALLAEHLGDDHRGGDAGGHADVHGREGARAEGEARGLQAHEEGDHDAGADGVLEEASEEHDLAHLQQLLDVQLHADHEEQEDEAQLAELRDVVVAVHDAQHLRAHQHATEQVAQDQRLLQHIHQQCHEADTREGEGDVVEQLGYRPEEPPPVPPMVRVRAGVLVGHVCPAQWGGRGPSMRRTNMRWAQGTVWRWRGHAVQRWGRRCTVCSAMIYHATLRSTQSGCCRDQHEKHASDGQRVDRCLHGQLHTPGASAHDDCVEAAAHPP